LRLLHLILLDKRSNYKQEMIGKGEIIATRYNTPILLK